MEEGDAESWEEADAIVEASETDEDTDEEMAAEWWRYGPAVELGSGGVILVLFETPSGFAIFSYDGTKLRLPNASQTVWLVDFETFEDKLSAINLSTGVSDGLAAMIKEHIVPGQKLAVETEGYKKAIENSLEIDCLYDADVEELMWGLKIQMPYLVPEEKQKPDEDLFPMSEGMKFLLNFHGFTFEPNMMVTRRIIELAGIVHGCDLCVNKHGNNLHSVAEYLKDISRIDTQDWDLMKIATALMLICYPNEKVAATRSLFSTRELARLWKDRPKYDGKILKKPLLVVYNEIKGARKSRYQAARLLNRLLRQTTKAPEGVADPDGEKEIIKRIWSGEEAQSVINKLTECNYQLIEERKRRQIPLTLAPIDALERYTHISSHPLHRTNEPGILSIDIHPSMITSLKFVNRDELFLTGSADKTVRIWQGSEDGNYSCIHTIEDHTAEVEAVTVHATQKYFVAASNDSSWRFYDILTGSCLTQHREASEQEGYTSASFHPDGLLLGTGTTAVAKIWDVKSQLNVAKLKGHIGPVTAMSFSENGYHLATAACDGVKIWDVRKYRYFMTFAPYCLDITTNAVEFDLSGSYLAMGGSDVRVFHVDKDKWSFIKKLPDPSRKGKVTSIKFGTDAKYIAVGSLDHNLRIFGLPGDEPLPLEMN